MHESCDAEYRLGVGLFASEPDQVDHLRVESRRQAREREPGQILLPTLDPGYGDGMQVRLRREGFDTEIAILAKTADRGS